MEQHGEAAVTTKSNPMRLTSLSVGESLHSKCAKMYAQLWRTPNKGSKVALPSTAAPFFPLIEDTDGMILSSHSLKNYSHFQIREIN